jgi:V/A-type H+-transporting ATPase subunit F
VREILVVTPPGLNKGFALAGIRHQEVPPDEAASALRAAIDDPEIGVIAVDERLLAPLDTRCLQALTERWNGVLVTLPAPAGPACAEVGELQRLIRRALGYHVRLEP